MELFWRKKTFKEEDIVLFVLNSLRKCTVAKADLWYTPVLPIPNRLRFPAKFPTPRQKRLNLHSSDGAIVHTNGKILHTKEG